MDTFLAENALPPNVSTKVGLTTSSLPDDVVSQIETEDDLLALNQHQDATSISEDTTGETETSLDSASENETAPSELSAEETEGDGADILVDTDSMTGDTECVIEAENTDVTERSCVEVHNETAVIDSQSEDEGADVLVGNLLNTDVPQQIQELGRRIRQRRHSAAEAT